VKGSRASDLTFGNAGVTIFPRFFRFKMITCQNQIPG
jgi:hypothetical protein